MIRSLNWKELAQLVSYIRPQIQGLFVDKIFIPERPQFLEGYIKAEWHLRLHDRSGECTLQFSLRPQNVYVNFALGKGLKASIKATHSNFDLALSKYLKGTRVVDVTTISRERVVVIRFSQSGGSDYGLILTLIPAASKGYLVELGAGLSTGPWPVLAHTGTQTVTEYSPPDGVNAPENPPPSCAYLDSLQSFKESYSQWIQDELKAEAFQQRCLRTERILKLALKTARDRFERNQASFQQAQKERDWQAWGDLLKGAIGVDGSRVSSDSRTVLDYATGKEVVISCDPQLSLVDQIQLYYKKAKRKQRRIAEASERLQEFQQEVVRLQAQLAERPEAGDWSTLKIWEARAGISDQSEADLKQRSTKAKHRWNGKVFLAKNGSQIWVGRTRDENLELTFKYARGNDLWLHVRGKPGAHAVIPLAPSQSAALDTLLDAAHLVIHYSGGANWGTTEVDYTFKKYVKRIKDSKEVSYTNNKTLLVKIDPERMKRLLG